MTKFVNPNYINRLELEAQARYVKYQPYIVEFFNQLGDQVETVSFDDVRAYFQGHPLPEIRAQVEFMTDGLLHDLCNRHGIELV